MDPRKKDEKEEEKDEQQAAPASPSKMPADKPKTRAASRTSGDGSKPVYGRFDDEPDQIKYRSMAVATAPALGMGAISGQALMHGAGLPSMGGLAGMPTPLSRSAAGAKKASTGPRQSTSAPTFGPRVDRTNYVNVTPRDLPASPFRLEMHTHFHVKGESMQRVGAVVGRKLSELDTDFEFKADKCKWKVDYRRANMGTQRVSLNIVLFKTGKEYILEAQRRDGDITALMHLYNELKASFKTFRLLADKDNKPSVGVKRPAPKALPKLRLTPANVRDGVSSIKGLLESKFVDAQMQGVLGAISLSAEDDSRSAMASLVPQLVLLGQSKNAGVAKLVRVALSRLCDHPECRQAFVESDGWQFIVQCAAGGADVNPEVQRESLHVVECLCSLYSDELSKVEGAEHVLALIQDWESIEDPRLKKHACNAHRALKDAGVIA
jgi:hypothetical protein